MEQLEPLVRSLAVFRPERGCCISLFLDLDPSDVPTAKDLSSHITSVVDDAKRRLEALSERLDHDRTLAAREDIERAAVFFEEELDRSGAGGFALYLSGLDGIRHEVPLPTPVDDAAQVGRTFALAPLLEPLERDRELILAAVGRERGTLWRSRNGRTELVDDRTEEIQGRHDQGGWSQARFQRSVEHEADDHLRDVAELLADRIRPGSGTLLVVACVEELRTRFEELLAPHVREALLGWTTVEAHAGEHAIEPEAERLLEERLEEEREGLLERFHEERGNDGLATASWEEAVPAAADARIDTALVDGRTTEAWVCPKCERGSVSAGSCEIDGTPLEEAPGGALELVIRGTLANGGTVRLVNGSRLGETEGVAAILRFPLTPRE